MLALLARQRPSHHSAPLLSHLSNLLLEPGTSLASQHGCRSMSISPPTPVPVELPAGRTKRLVVGQPLHHTHPHLLSPGELTPGLQAAEYKERRQRLCSLLPQGSVAILPSATTTFVSGVIPYPFRQEADFFYLTGLQQHGIVVLQTGATPDDIRFTLFIEAPDPQVERWNGPTVNTHAALEVFGADQAFHTSQIHVHLSTICQEAQQVFFDTDRFNAYCYTDINSVLAYSMPRSGVKPNSNALHHIVTQGPTSLRPYLHRMRAVKSPAEVALMRRSAQLSARAIATCMAASHPGVHEHWLASTFEYECKRQGASRMAFPQVVAGGVDAVYVHYGRNDKVISGSDMVLMDAGCELYGYGSDVTRTWPVGGRYSSAHRAAYDVVLAAHQKCVAACKPGVRLRDLHHISVSEISAGIKDLGLCKGATLTQIQSSLYRDFYWHSVGHWLGLDIHDTHLIGHDRPLLPGHIITIEPGLYIPDEARFGAVRGIGVRIEDDVLVTEDGCEVLSAGVPHHPDQVEALVGSSNVAQ